MSASRATPTLLATLLSLTQPEVIFEPLLEPNTVAADLASMLEPSQGAPHRRDRRERPGRSYYTPLE